MSEHILAYEYILAIDPGNVYSGVVVVDEKMKPVYKGKLENNELLVVLKTLFKDFNIKHVAIEMIASYGMSVGVHVFETCIWIGRFYQMIDFVAMYYKRETNIKFIYRKDEKITICGSMKAKDANIRRALIDMFAKHDYKNGKGTKKNPDWFYGFAKDMWQAYAVAYTYRKMYL